MLKKTTYKRMLAVSVLSALMGSGSVMAANVETGYTSQMGTTDAVEQADTEVATASATSPMNASAAPSVGGVHNSKEAEELAAITAARGDTAISEDGTVVQAPDGSVKVDNSALSTSDKEVKMVSKVTGGTDLDKAAQDANNQADANVQAQFVSAVTPEMLKPYLGKTITGLSVTGLEPGREAELLSNLKDKVGDKVTEEGILADIKGLGNTGVFSEVNPVITVVPEGVKVAYQVTLNPVVKGIQFEGNTVYSSENLVNYLNVQPGTVLNSVYVGQKIQGINAAYQRDGYTMAHVSGLSVDNDGIVHITIVEGVVEDIVPAGNKKTRDKVITREFIQKKGKPFNAFLVRRSVERVYNLGFFDDVNVRILPGSTPDAVVIEVDVLEHKTGTITLGAGYSESDGLVGIIELGEDNLRGTGDKVKIHWEVGGKDNYKNYQISYLHPWLDHKGTSLGFSFFNREDEYTDYDAHGHEVAEYNKKTNGFNVSLGRQTGEYTRDTLTLETRNDKYRWKDGDSSGFRYDRNQGAGGSGDNTWDNKTYDFKDFDYVGKNFGRTNSITWQKVYDSRNNIYDPSRGKRISYTAQWAGHGLGGDFDFYKFTAEGRMYRKLGNGHVLAFRARGGFIQGEAPYSQLFTLGGADSLRGYEDDQFRGKYMYNATLEYRFPLVKKVSGVLFTDIGDAWDAPNVPWYESKKGFNASVGAGLRVQTPIGPIKLDYGKGKEDSKFHFSFGTQF